MTEPGVYVVLAIALAGRRLTRVDAIALARSLRRFADLPPSGPHDLALAADLRAAADVLDAQAAVRGRH